MKTINRAKIVSLKKKYYFGRQVYSYRKSAKISTHVSRTSLITKWFIDTKTTILRTWQQNACVRTLFSVSRYGHKSAALAGGIRGEAPYQNFCFIFFFIKKKFLKSSENFTIWLFLHQSICQQNRQIQSIYKLTKILRQFLNCPIETGILQITKNF